MWKRKLREALTKKLEKRGKSTRENSLREFASAVGISSGALSEIARGKRSLTPRTASRILEGLDLAPAAKAVLRSEIEAGQAKKRVILDAKASALFVDWVPFAVLSVLELDSPPTTASAIARHLGITVDRSRKALGTLLDQDQVVKEGDTYRTLHRSLSTTDNEPDSQIEERHRRNIGLAGLALEELEVDKRDFLSLTFSGSSRAFEKARKETRRFVNRLSAQLSNHERDSVYHMNIQLFPLEGWEKRDR